MTKKKIQTHQIATRKLILIIAILIGIIGTVYWITRNDTLFTADKQKTKDKLSALISSAQLPGTLVYKEVVDNECNNDGSVGLAIRVGCNFEAFALFKNSQDSNTDLFRTRQYLESKGFKESYNNSLRDGKAIGEKSETMAKPILLTQSTTDFQIQNLISKGKIAAPVDKEYIFGLYTSAGYYYCSDGSFFKQSCPTPPSPVR